MTTEIVASFVEGNTLAPGDLPQMFEQVFRLLNAMDATGDAEVSTTTTPAVSIKKSVTKSHIACLECGKKFKTLKRHLKSAHGLTAEGYRRKWGLAFDYPLVAENYAQERSNLAKASGLGRNGRDDDA